MSLNTIIWFGCYFFVNFLLYIYYIIYKYTFNRLEIKKIKETCLYINNLDQAEDFYHRRLSLPLISRVEGSHIFFRAGKSVLLCFIPEASKVKENLPPHYAYGNQHLAFEVSPEAYEEWKEKIKKEGIPIIHEQTWKDGYRSFYFKDPEDNVLEILPEGAIWEDTE